MAVSRATRGVGPQALYWGIEGPKGIIFGLGGVPSPPTHFWQFSKNSIFGPPGGGGLKMAQKVAEWAISRATRGVGPRGPYRGIEGP